MLQISCLCLHVYIFFVNFDGIFKLFYFNIVYELSLTFAIGTLIQCQIILELTKGKLQMIKMKKNSFRVCCRILYIENYDKSPLLSRLFHDHGPAAWSTFCKKTITGVLPQLLNCQMILNGHLCLIDVKMRASISSKAVIGRTAISLNHLSRPTCCTRYIDQSSFISIATRTDVYKFSFFPHTVNDWNSAPAEVRLKLSSPSDESLELFN